MKVDSVTDGRLLEQSGRGRLLCRRVQVLPAGLRSHFRLQQKEMERTIQ